MRAHRGGRRQHRRREHRPTDIVTPLERDDAVREDQPLPSLEDTAVLEDGREGVRGYEYVAADVVSDSRWVQFADLTGCDITGCREVAVPEPWELVDLDTGAEAPGRFCEDHQLAWVRRPELEPVAMVMSPVLG